MHPEMTDAKFMLDGYNLNIEGRYPVLTPGTMVRLEDIEYQLVKAILIVSDDRKTAHFRYDLGSSDSDSMARIVASNSNVNNNASSIFDSFDEVMRDGIPTYIHKSCRAKVNIKLTETNVGEKLRALIRHYDTCLRQRKGK